MKKTKTALGQIASMVGAKEKTIAREFNTWAASGLNVKFGEWLKKRGYKNLP